MPRQPKKPKPPPERDIWPECLKWLNNQPFIWAWRRNVVVMKRGARWIRSGQKGQSDLTGTVTMPMSALRGEPPIDGEPVVGLRLEVEVKRPGETPTPEQRAWLVASATHGAIALWADSVPSLEFKMRRGFRRRGWRWPERDGT